MPLGQNNQIFTKLAKWKELNQGKITREFVNRQSFLYLGRNYRLSIVENQELPLKISGGYFTLDKKHLDRKLLLSLSSDKLKYGDFLLS